MKSRETNKMMDGIIETIRSGCSFVLTTHVNPEGDAIGSEVALALALEKMGKEVLIVNQDPVPYFLKFLEGTERIRNDDPGGEYDVGVLLDCGSPERSGTACEVINRCNTVICIDHHLTNGGYGHHSYIDPDASSTGELIYRLLKTMDFSFDRSIANALWVAIATDTGWFRYSNTTAAALEVARDLIDKGAVPWVVSESMCENEPPERLILLSRVLSTLEIVEDGKIASITIPRKYMEDLRANNDFLEGFINYPRSIRGVMVAVSFREDGSGAVKVSMRAKGSADVVKVAIHFGGGGHRKAAGFVISGDVSAVKKKTYTKIAEMLRECHGAA
jgi:phosphoesterase RecJ-like protein